MNNMLKQLDTIKNVGVRLRDLAKSRAVPPNIMEILQNDSESIRWAHSELRSLYIVDAAVLVCSDDSVKNAFDMLKPSLFETVDGSSFIESGDGGKWSHSCVAVVFKPDTVALELLRDKFNFNDKEMSDDDSLSWLSCKKYYVSKFSSSSAVLFECSLSKKWLDEIGLREARPEIYGWAIKSLATVESKGE
jgi:hypothetical protein